MAFSRIILQLFLFLAYGIFNTVSGDYTYVTNATVKAVNTSMKYFSVTDRVEAEGDAISSALNTIESVSNIFHVGNRNTMMIVCSTGINGIALINGERKRLSELTPNNHGIPCKIIVVYTIDYANRESSTRQARLASFHSNMNQLVITARNYNTEILLQRLDISIHDLQDGDYGSMKPKSPMDREQISHIKKCIAEDPVKASIIDVRTFKSQLSGVRVLADGVTRTEDMILTNKNYLLMAIYVALTRVMGEAITDTQNTLSLFVVCIGAPSGINEMGEWLRGPGFEVDVLLSCGWNQQLVNSEHLIHSTTVLVLNIRYKETSFFSKLEEYLKSIPYPGQEIFSDVARAKALGNSAIGFKDQAGRMVPVAA